jgi:PAS domain S-box-containing protein
MSDIDWPARVRLTSALNQAAIVAITDRGGRILYCNDKFVAVSGYAAEDLIGKTHRVVNSGVHGPEIFEALYAAISSGQAWRGTLCNRNRSGELYWVDTTIIPTLDESGRPEFYTAIRFEVTAHIQALRDLEEAKISLERAGQARDLFYANISHEIRTPLNAVLGLTSALGQTALTPDQAGMLDVIQASGTALSRQLDDMLDLSKMQAGQFRLSPAPFELRGVVSCATAAFKAAAKAKGLRFDLAIGDGVQGVFLGDSGRLGQVIGNLASNAVKFTQAGSVGISADVEGTGTPAPVLRLEVRDTGIGFDDAIRQTLFKPYAQAQEGISRRFGGSGLGLPICKTLLEMMGGEITAEGKLGEGSVFRVRLPLQPIEPVEAEPDAGNAQAAEPGGLKVLLVEDNLANQRVVSALLEPLGVEISIANNGAEGVEAYGLGGFDAVLMDMQMPVMNGIEATREIRRLEAEKGRVRTPIVMLTANTTEGHHRMAEEAGCDGILIKPIDLKRLVEGLSEGAARAEGCRQAPA